MQSMQILIVDNYDSFTFNLVQLVENCNIGNVEVIKNDSIINININVYDAIIISPGPGLPDEAGQLLPFLKKYQREIPILGVCLGLQAIVVANGGTLKQLPSVQHGMQATLQDVDHDDTIFKDLGNPILVGRYHSWVAEKHHFPSDLIPTSFDTAGNIMSLKHKNFPVFGVQFHPESILTPKGSNMMSNFINHVKEQKFIPINSL